jgi:hypothetical protein
MSDHNQPDPTPSRFVEVDPDQGGPPPRPLEVTLLIGVTVVASLVSIFYGGSVLFAGGLACCCCFAPVGTLQLVLGIVGLVYAGRQLSPYPPPFPMGLAVAFMATVLACDPVSAILGLVMLVLTMTDGARVYYARAALAKMATGAGE